MVDKFIRKIVPSSIYNRVRAAFVFSPEDEFNLHQITPRFTSYDGVKGFRYPAPGSERMEKNAQGLDIKRGMMSSAAKPDPYDVKFYTEDPKNLPKMDELFINSATNPTVIKPLNDISLGNPGNKEPAVLRYDPTGLRATVTASYAELEKAIEANARPNHLPVSGWEGHEVMEKECERKNIPYTMGNRCRATPITSNYNEVRWEPYDIQRELMKEMYECVEERQIGLFESPTGTGKSLSILCTLLQWQKCEEGRILAMHQPSQSIKASDNWLDELQLKSKTSTVENASEVVKQYDDMTLRIRKFSSLDAKLQSAENYFGGDVAASEPEAMDSVDCSVSLGLPKIYYCSRTHSQISQFVSEVKGTAYSNVRCITLGSRNNYCVNEAVRASSKFTISERCLDLQNNKSAKNEFDDDLELAPTSTVSSLEPSAKKAKCSKSGSGACPHHNKQKEKLFGDCALNAIRDIEELVQLGKTSNICPYYGSRQAIPNAQLVCLPYAMLLCKDTREALGITIQPNDVIVCDEAHNLVDAINQMHSCELSVCDVDESLNAVKWYISRFQSQLSGENFYHVNLLRSVLQCVKRYFDSATNRNKSSNKEGCSNTGTGAYRSVGSPNDFIFATQLDNINIAKLVSFLTLGHFVRKIGGFAFNYHQRQLAEEGSGDGQGSRSEVEEGVERGGGKTGAGRAGRRASSKDSPTADPNAYINRLRKTLQFLSCLANFDSDGRIVYNAVGHSRTQTHTEMSNKSSDQTQPGSPLVSSVSFVLLNPSAYFHKIVQQARSILLIGGTLQPFSYLTSHLFPNVPRGKLRIHSCGHVIPASSLRALSVSVGPSGSSLDFRHNHRSLPSALRDLSMSLLSITSHAAYGGIVVFFTSYAYMEVVVAYLKATTGGDPLEEPNTFWRLLSQHRKVHVEAKGVKENELVWESYKSSCLHSHVSAHGASTSGMLCCVMGGKLSEGINFSNDLARVVVVVGLPYPDPRDPVLQEKVKYAASALSGLAPTTGGAASAMQSKGVYESMCMKSVNQSIGRSIRHIGDFASIILLDSRFQDDCICQLLPKWIAAQLVKCSSFAQSMDELTCFFRAHSMP